MTVTLAKLMPKLKLCEAIIGIDGRRVYCTRTRIPQTIDISRAVGTTWKRIEVRRKDMPLRRKLSDILTAACSYPLRPSVDGPRKTACISRKMELRIEIEEVSKDIARNSPDCTLSHIREYCISQFGEESRTNTCEAV